MKTIKFRGKDRDNMLVYGDLTHEDGFVYIDEIRVDPDSVAQLVGYDADGKEIYEGDVCVDKYYCTYREKAGLMATFNNFISGDEYQHFSYYKLKER